MGTASVCVLICVGIPAYSAVLDRIAVTVGKQVIAESDLIRDLCVDAFIDRKPVDLSPAAKRTAALRLVDQILMLREASDSHLDLTAPDDATRMLAEEKSKFASEDEYQKALAEYHITEADLREHLLNGLHLSRFTDLRFRPGVQVSNTEIRERYEALAATWRRGGRNPIPTFEESQDQVEKLLTEDLTMKALDEWLMMQRESKEIQYREAAFK
jgi:hypothetical protein